ncbi:ABC transporter substrate-binding protein [Clostridium sp. DL1XJH146]
MIKFKGMTWSHDRGVKPLLAASSMFNEKNKDVEIEWDARSLSDFELYPLEKLATEYDFIMIDHPHIGSAYAQNLLLPLDELLDEEYLKNQEENSVGLSYKSYNWENHQWAIPADSAAQVCAYRKDLLQELDINVPSSWEEVYDLANKLPEDKKMCIPFVPVHAYSSFFTVCSQLNDKIFWSDESDLDLEVGEKALIILQNILNKSSTESYDFDPINVLDKMGSEDEIVYVPLIYGYSNYSREGYLNNVVNVGNIPSSNGIPKGSMIGGVGLSISSKCKYPDIAAKFVEMVVSEEFQKTTFFENAGQPGHRAAWIDEKVNSQSNDFFAATLETLDCGSMRPRFNGYIDFQAKAGSMIRNFVKENRKDYKEFVEELNELIKVCRNNSGL